MLDDRVRSVIARLEEEDEAERAAGVPDGERSSRSGPMRDGALRPRGAERRLRGARDRQVAGLLDDLARSRRAHPRRSRRLPRAGSRKIEAWRENIADAGLEEWAELVENALETLETVEDGVDVVFVDAWKADYERYFQIARGKVEPGAVIVADNVVSHVMLAGYVQARQSDPTLLSVTVHIGSGLEVTTVLR